MKDTPKQRGNSHENLFQEKIPLVPQYGHHYVGRFDGRELSTTYLSLTTGRVNPAKRIYAIMDNFLKFLHFFKGEREREGRRLPLTACRLVKILFLNLHGF